MQDWLHDVFGGDIEALNEEGRALSPDYIWRNKLWDLKTPDKTNHNTLEKRIGHGIKQIFSSSRGKSAGGLIVDLSQCGYSFEDGSRLAVEKAVKKSKGVFDLIVKKNDRYVVYRINKK
ncbi:MAG: hypothetical protein II882_07750 [Lachnospiraceae bacterium]|nr:hypothetical protein [Lachnospiraceae bacterium]